MSTETITRAICDRCGHAEEGCNPDRNQQWGTVSFSSNSSYGGLRLYEGQGDLCRDCLKELSLCWNAPQTAVAA